MRSRRERSRLPSRNDSRSPKLRRPINSRKPEESGRSSSRSKSQRSVTWERRARPVDGDLDKKGPRALRAGVPLLPERRQDLGARHGEQQVELRRKTMSVYMVYICHSVSDRAQLEKYWTSI